MLELEYHTRHPEEKEKKNQEDQEIVENEFDDNFVTIQGLFVEGPMDNIIIDENEISEFTSLTKSTLMQKQYIPFKYDPEFFINSAKDLFERVEVYEDKENSSQEGNLQINIEGIHINYYKNSQLLECSWNASPKLDLVTDAIGLLALQLCKY